MPMEFGFNRYLHLPCAAFVISLVLFTCLFKFTYLYSRTQGICYYPDEGRTLFKVVCYYTLPPDESQLQPVGVDPFLCTHIIIGFAQVVNSSIEPNNISDYKVYQSVISLKKINPSLKILLSVAEQDNSFTGFPKLVAFQELRAKFAKQCLEIVTRFGFDGIDLDWEFPSWPQPNPDQTANFTLLLYEIRAQFKDNYLLTVAVSGSGNIIRQSYDIPGIAKAVDFVNLMAYDYHMYSPEFPVTGPNAPLYSRPTESGLLATLNTNWSANHWNTGGIPKEKIILGIPTYGHSFNLLNEDNNGWGAPANGFGSLGKGGFISQAEACTLISNPSTTHVFDEDYQVPYAYSGKEWISYENTISVTRKAYYIALNRFGGAMIYSLNSDDFLGECGKETFPLTRKISYYLFT